MGPAVIVVGALAAGALYFVKKAYQSSGPQDDVLGDAVDPETGKPVTTITINEHGGTIGQGGQGLNLDALDAHNDAVAYNQALVDGVWGAASAGMSLGAALGKVVPVIGTAIGAVAGAFIGFFAGVVQAIFGQKDVPPPPVLVNQVQYPWSQWGMPYMPASGQADARKLMGAKCVYYLPMPDGKAVASIELDKTDLQNFTPGPYCWIPGDTTPRGFTQGVMSLLGPLYQPTLERLVELAVSRTSEGQSAESINNIGSWLDTPDEVMRLAEAIRCFWWYAVTRTTWTELQLAMMQATAKSGRPLARMEPGGVGFLLAQISILCGVLPNFVGTRWDTEKPIPSPQFFDYVYNPGHQFAMELRQWPTATIHSMSSATGKSLWAAWVKKMQAVPATSESGLMAPMTLYYGRTFAVNVAPRITPDPSFNLELARQYAARPLKDNTADILARAQPNIYIQSKR